MSDNIASIRNDIWKRMRRKETRDNFVTAQISTGIAAQLITLRESRDWQKQQLAEKSGMAPARISVMENPSYDRFTLSTLKRLASAFDVALMVRFVPFSEFVDWIAELNPEKLDAVSYIEDSLVSKQTVTSSLENIIYIHQRQGDISYETSRTDELKTDADRSFPEPQYSQKSAVG